MLHPRTRLTWIDDTIGIGVIATERIPRGTVTWMRDALDLTFSAEQMRALGPAYADMLDRYAYKENDGTVLCWDHGRFVNHHCEPTCLGLDGAFEVAIRDIEAGEQITDDYGSLGLDSPMPCSCGAARCRGEIRPDDPANHMAGWRLKYDAAERLMATVPQPLVQLLKDQVPGGPVQLRGLCGNSPVVSAVAH